jgi:hypothetical protein
MTMLQYYPKNIWEPLIKRLERRVVDEGEETKFLVNSDWVNTENALAKVVKKLKEFLAQVLDPEGIKNLNVQ